MRRVALLRTLAVAACAAVVLDCSSSSGTSPQSVGNLVVLITEPEAATPSVTITGPGGYKRTLTASTLLSGLPVGTYTVTADSVVAPDSIVGTFVDTASVSGSPAVLGSLDTAHVTVLYANKRRLGGLWAANGQVHTLPVYSPLQLRSSGGVLPADTLVGGVGYSLGIALDPSGNLWVAQYEGDTIVEYSVAARESHQGPTGLLADSAICAGYLAFDAHGNLWTPDVCNGVLVAFTPAQQAAGGNQTPAITIHSAALLNPLSLAFDANGNLWVGDQGLTHIVEFTAAQLAASGTVTPADTIGNNGALTSLQAIAFDPGGNLWVTHYGVGIVEFTPAQLAAGGSPTPHVSITSISYATGLAFDRRGGLWIGDYAYGLIYELTAAQLATSGAPFPAVTLTTLTSPLDIAPEGIVFDPGSTAVGVPAATHARPISSRPSLASRANPAVPRRRP